MNDQKELLRRSLEMIEKLYYLHDVGKKTFQIESQTLPMFTPHDKIKLDSLVRDLRVNIK